LPFTQRRRLLYAEAKVLELLCHCADDLVAHPDVAPVMDMFTERELHMFEEARRILSSHFSPTPTISYLARAVGTNTSKLKRGFKLIYGTTIFELGHQYRMKRALELLATERLSVGTVAEMIGYQYQASFASAFKDYYGFLPKDARKRHSGA
jgi:AraC-like DNA-binding protein